MAHNLTEVDAHTTPVVVPNGTDSHTVLAEYIEAIAQALANRTNRLNLHAALKNVANVFTAAPQEVNVNDASLAAIITRTMASDDAEPGNLWKAVVSHRFSTPSWVNIYAGTEAADGQYLIAINAVWTPADQEFTQDDDTLDSFAVILDMGTGLRVSKVAAGAAAWATWPVTAGDISAFGAFFDAVTATNGYSAGAAGDYGYSPVKLRTSIIPSGKLQAGGHNGGNGATLAVGGGSGFGYLDLTLPSNATPGTIEVVHHQTTTTPTVFHLAKRTPNFAGPGASTETYVVTYTGPAAIGYDLAVLDCTGVTIDPTCEYRLLWDAGDDADDFDVARFVDWQDAGPRNDL